MSQTRIRHEKRRDCQTFEQGAPLHTSSVGALKKIVSQDTVCDMVPH